jgi:hypothetical protein
MSLPLVFLFDMDGTLIGDSMIQLCRYELSQLMGFKYDYKLIKDELDNGLLRPHFESFIKTINIKYPYAEVFIYTAAQKEWASVMISFIEKHIGNGFKFNRPIFSREYCLLDNGIVIKSIGKLAPIIYKKLKKKYNLQSSSDLKKQIVLIDNNHVIHSVDGYRFIKCPSYEHFVISNIIENIPEKKIKQYLTTIVAILGKYSFFNNSQMSSLSNSNNICVSKFYSNYYASLSDLYKKHSSHTNKSLKEGDRFWLSMERIFRNHNIKSFNKKVVVYINKSF